MIHINYSTTKKEYLKTYIQVMTLSYMKIYFVVLSLGIMVTGLLGLIFSNSSLGSTSRSLLVTFIPTLFFCLGLSVLLSYFECKKTIKRYPEILEGNFKVRFEKAMITWQINGTNNRFGYKDYVIRKGFKNTIVISNPEYYNIVLPANLMTTEQYKKVKSYIRG